MRSSRSRTARSRRSATTCCSRPRARSPPPPRPPPGASIPDAGARVAPRIGDGRLDEIVGAVPAAWLGGEERRGDYVGYLRDRLAAPRAFAAEAEEARART